MLLLCLDDNFLIKNSLLLQQTILLNSKFMKKTVFFIAFVLLGATVFAQQPEVRTIYAELVGFSNLLGTKVTVDIDMGQSKGALGLNTSYIVDEKGKPKKFNSMVDAMNYMGDMGWEFCQAYVVTSATESVYHWLLKQNIQKGTDGNYYPVTKKLFEKN